MINNKTIHHLRCHKGLTCIPCIPDNHGGYSVKTYKSAKALIQHIRKSHTLSPEEFEKIQVLIKKYESLSFIQYCYDVGYLY
ncbi:MAG: hypothetical protein IIC67_00640 [Thaumarchaeota archaeon]|nr:hypothetical protein [Nitrososphaerota archaeon]